MDRFKRFLGKFALYFGLFAVAAVGITGIFRGVELLGRVFGPDVATMGVLFAFGTVFAAAWAWSDSRTYR